MLKVRRQMCLPSYSTVATMLLLDVNVKSDCNDGCLAPTLRFLRHLFMPCTPLCPEAVAHCVSKHYQPEYCTDACNVYASSAQATVHAHQSSKHLLRQLKST